MLAQVTCRAEMNWIREHFPYGGNDHILSIDFWQGVVHIHLEEKPDYEQSAWLLHQREVDEIITSFDFTDDAPQAELQPSTIHVMRLEVGFHALHFEENIQVVRLHFPDISRIDFQNKTATFVLADELTQEQSDWLHFAEFEGHYIASHEVQDTPQPDVLYESPYRRVVKVASDYQYGVTDTILELAEQGYTSHLVAHSERGTDRIHITAAIARQLVTELETWEKEHGDAHPF